MYENPGRVKYPIEEHPWIDVIGRRLDKFTVAALIFGGKIQAVLVVNSENPIPRELKEYRRGWNPYDSRICHVFWALGVCSVAKNKENVSLAERRKRFFLFPPEPEEELIKNRIKKILEALEG